LTDERARLRAIQGGGNEPPAEDRTFEGRPFLEIGPSGRQRFVAPRLAGLLRQQSPIASGGGKLYVYRSGAYRPEGDADLRRRVVEALGEEWTRARSDEVLTYLHHSSPHIWEEPPLDKINVQNGMLYLEGEPFLDPHDPDILSPIQISAAYDPAATCPAIDEYIAETLPNGEHLIHELAGYLATPDNRYQRAFMCLGPSGTGKSTMLDLLCAFIGRQNVSSVALQQLDGEDRFATADLYGRLANVFADIPASALRSSSIFKSITGGDHIRAERKNRPAFEFKPYARMIFSANSAPPTSDSSGAFFDRWTILPFTKRYRNTPQQKHKLIEQLTTPQELSGLLNHAIRGLARLHEHRTFTTTAAMDEAGARYARDADTVAGFLEEECELAVELRVAKPRLYQSYKSWCERCGRKSFAAQRFNERLEELGEGSIQTGKKYGGIKMWDGIRVRGEV
jgi:putative DNA primase/helicase